MQQSGSRIISRAGPDLLRSIFAIMDGLGMMTQLGVIPAEKAVASQKTSQGDLYSSFVNAS
jgi:hypothetical protein